jgi:cobalamin biosynthesis protein CbiG
MNTTTNTAMNVAAVCINDRGEAAAALLAQQLSHVTLFRTKQEGELPDLTAELFYRYEGLVFFCAAGIVVRMIAPHLKNKHEDPAVVVVDNGCRYAVSLLSGHEGGANELAFKVSRVLAALPVVTTATEAAKTAVIGIGARRGITGAQIKRAVENSVKAAGVSLSDIRAAATLGIKCVEPGVLSALNELSLPLLRVSYNTIRSFSGAFRESAASRHLGIPAVAEPCALIAAREGRLILPARNEDGVTVAIAAEKIGAVEISTETAEMANE